MRETIRTHLKKKSYSCLWKKLSLVIASLLSFPNKNRTPRLAGLPQTASRVEIALFARAGQSIFESRIDRLKKQVGSSFPQLRVVAEFACNPRLYLSQRRPELVTVQRAVSSAATMRAWILLSCSTGLPVEKAVHGVCLEKKVRAHVAGDVRSRKPESGWRSRRCHPAQVSRT